MSPPEAPPHGDRPAGGAPGPPAPDRSLRIVLGILVGLGLALTLFAVLLWNAAPPRSADVGPGATVLPVPLPLEEFALTDQDGAPFDLGRLRGRWSLLFFGYTYCPDVCPFVLQELARVRRLLDREEGAEPAPQVVFVSVDPERDTPERLAEYVRFFHPEFIGASGSPESLQPLTRVLGVYHQKREVTAGSEYLVDHTSTLFLVDPDANLFAVLEDPHAPEEFAARLARVRALKR